MSYAILSITTDGNKSFQLFGNEKDLQRARFLIEQADSVDEYFPYGDYDEEALPISDIDYTLTELPENEYQTILNHVGESAGVASVEHLLGIIEDELSHRDAENAFVEVLTEIVKGIKPKGMSWYDFLDILKDKRKFVHKDFVFDQVATHPPAYRTESFWMGELLDIHLEVTSYMNKNTFERV